VGVGAGNKANGGVEGDAASFMPKTNFDRGKSGLRFLVLMSTLP
jgi:hypothetical protein